MAKPEDNNTGNEAVQEGAAGGSSEQTMPKSKKESYMEGFRKKYPDWKDDDEEGFYGALADEQKAWDEERSGYESREKEVSDDRFRKTYYHCDRSLRQRKNKFRGESRS